MKKFSFALVFYLAFSPLAYVRSNEYLPPQGKGDLFFGQNHSYSVTFRGNGEAVVYAKFLFRNLEDQPMSEFMFEIPKIEPSELVVLQQGVASPCVRYDYSSGQSYCLEYAPSAQNELDDSWPNPISGEEYKKAQISKNGAVYKARLPYPIGPDNSGLLVLAYTGKGYVKKTLGLYKFQFETVKVPERIANVRVAVDVDSELLLKGKRSKVEYSQPVTSMPMALDFQKGVASSELDRTVSNIGSLGPLVKEAKSLAPNDSLVVRGEYAYSWWSLNLKAIIWTIVILAVVIAAFFYLRRWLFRRRKAQESLVAASAEPKEVKKNESESVVLSSLGAGLMSALLVIILTIPVTKIDQWFSPYYFGPIFALLMLIAIFLLYVLVVFGPGAWLAFKKGWKALFLTVVFEIIWLVILGFLYSLVFSGSLGSRYVPIISR